MNTSSPISAKTWLVAQLVIARVRLGEGLSIRKLTNAALMSGHAPGAFLAALESLVADGHLARDPDDPPLRTVYLTLAGHLHVRDTRLAHGAAPGHAR